MRGRDVRPRPARVVAARLEAGGSSSDIRAAGGGRRVIATWPDADIALVEAINGVSGVDVHGNQIVIHTSDSAVFLSEGTVRNHLSSAIGKTGGRTRADAVRIAQENGWL